MGYIGDSIEQASSISPYQHGGDGYPTMIGLLTGQRIRTYINAGIGGQTTTQIKARLQTDLIDLHTVKPARCLVGGGTNDLPALQAAMQTSEAAGIAQAEITWSNLAWMYDRCRAAGIEPIGRTLPPRTSFASQIAYLNAGIRRLCERRGMHCLDIHGALVINDGTGGYISGYSADGVHPGPAGVQAIAARAIADLMPSFPAGGPLLARSNNSAENLVNNGLFTVDANLDGVADNWSTSGTDGTATYTIESGDTNIVGNWQVLETTVQGSGSRTFSQLIGSPGARYAVGDVLELCGLISTDIESGGSKPTIKVTFANGTPYSSAIAVYILSSDVTRAVFWVRVPVPSGTTSCSLQLINSEASPRGTGTVKIAQVTLINLTRMGLGTNSDLRLTA
ncbi:MAG: hypothetical protein IT337_09335 [Thermomicrobiales bacterium]|nr:hypothetical protein [Thermomicrobiales bacterium]